MLSARKLLVILIPAFLLWAGCSKTSSSQQSSTSPQSFNLGPLELQSDVASRQDLGNGEACVLVAHTMDRDTIQLIATLEKAGKKVASTRTGPIKTGVPLEISFGDVQVQFTLQMK